MTKPYLEHVGSQVLRYCREQGWAALESGISWPVPTMAGRQVRLNYLLYWSQLQGREQIAHEPFARIVVTYPEGGVEEHQPLPLASPVRAIGSFPYPEMARLSADERRAVWNEMFEAYPGAIAAFVGWPAAAPAADLRRFGEIMALVIPPYLREAYQNLNPLFFEWLKKV